MGFRVVGALTFNTRQRRDAAVSRWSTQATQRGWVGSVSPQGTLVLTFSYSRADASPAEQEAFAEEAYRFCHANGLVDGAMEVYET